MATFEIVEQEKLKMIRATLNGETVKAEPGALHYMQGRIEIEVKLPSAKGFLKALATQESVIKTKFIGTGEVYFGPPIFGEYMVMDLNNETWILDKGAFVCSDDSIEIGAFRNKAMTALFSGEGMFQTKIEGTGKVVIQADGPIEKIDLKDDRLTVDGSFAVARQDCLDFKLKKAAKSLLASAGSGEGIVSVIEGTGTVYLSPIPNVYASLFASIGGMHSAG